MPEFTMLLINDFKQRCILSAHIFIYVVKPLFSSIQFKLCDHVPFIGWSIHRDLFSFTFSCRVRGSDCMVVDITKIFLKVALNTITLTLPSLVSSTEYMSRFANMI